MPDCCLLHDLPYEDKTAMMRVADDGALVLPLHKPEWPKTNNPKTQNQSKIKPHSSASCWRDIPTALTRSISSSDSSKTSSNYTATSASLKTRRSSPAP